MILISATQTQPRLPHAMFGGYRCYIVALTKISPNSGVMNGVRVSSVHLALSNDELSANVGRLLKV
jgi:hypothetical protein